MFQLTFSVDTWLLHLGDTEPRFYRLNHRSLSGCEIVPTAGIGLGPGWSVENAFRHVGTVGYEVNSASYEGRLEFVNYCTHVADSYTCFGVRFRDNVAACLQDAEDVLATLSTVLNLYLSQ